MTTVVTLLRGSDALTLRWAGLYSLMGEGTDLVTSVASDFDERESVSLGAKTIHRNSPYAGNDEIVRVGHVAKILGELIKDVDSEFIILWDDDVVPPRDGIKRLSDGIKVIGAELAGIVSVIPFRGQPKSTDLVFRPFGSAVGQDAVAENAYHKVWSGGTGFSLWKTDILKSVLPLAPVISRNTVYGWDRDLAVKLKERNLITLADGSVRCDHDNLTD